VVVELEQVHRHLQHQVLLEDLVVVVVGVEAPVVQELQGREMLAEILVEALLEVLVVVVLEEQVEMLLGPSVEMAALVYKFLRHLETPYPQSVLQALEEVDIGLVEVEVEKEDHHSPEVLLDLEVEALVLLLLLVV
jgi:hypothetical protein